MFPWCFPCLPPTSFPVTYVSLSAVVKIQIPVSFRSIFLPRRTPSIPIFRLSPQVLAPFTSTFPWLPDTPIICITSSI
ncbi:hypothetical protein OIU79_030457 [Salix purpurea]|uniref:Uncharacterized protein n=1 Tax=Salix purpurea TaxID=77065 RepID=A0A9Q0V970_SALPP|nr:hypothetical protein OIU79_030457 [Salix purpurea]